MVAELHVQTHECFNERCNDCAAEAANRRLPLLTPSDLDQDLCAAGVGDEDDLGIAAESLPHVADRIEASLFLFGLHGVLRLDGKDEHPRRRSSPGRSDDRRRAERHG